MGDDRGLISPNSFESASARVRTKWSLAAPARALTKADDTGDSASVPNPLELGVDQERLQAARILIVDDEQQNLWVLSRILERAGYSAIQTTTDPRQVVQLVLEFNPDLILLDLHMPEVDGFTVLQKLGPVIPTGTYLPILMLTGDDRSEPKRQALAGGAKDFLLKPFDVIEVLLRIRNLLETRFLHLAVLEQNQDLERKVVARTQLLEESQIEVLERLASAAEFRDDDTGRHTQRVATGSAVLARALGLEEGTSGVIRRAAPLHDVGKIVIPDNVLLKPGGLTDEEFTIMKRHTTIGAKILSGGQTDLIQMAERIARSHHERWDGNGYPDGLTGETIPLEARLVAVADVFDALTHARPYRGAWPLEKVRNEIAKQSGRHFDPQVVRVFLSLASFEPLTD